MAASGSMAMHLGRCLLLLLLAMGRAAAVDDAWLHWFSAELRALERQRSAARAALAALGSPVIGQTVPQFGYQHPRVAAPPLTPPWVQVDLGEETTIDQIALVPAVLDWQADIKRTYGFPPRLRIDLADSADFARPVPVAIVADADLADPGIAPFIVRCGGRRARYVRVTVLKLAVETGQHFFALGELMVVSGRRNLAVGRPVTASGNLDLAPRWTLPNLVDGRTPLGPPIQLELLAWDGLFAGQTSDEPFTSMRLDLGREHRLQEIRLYAVHARLGADIPGFSFPQRFRVEAATSADFADATLLFSAEGRDFPNPGDNAVTIRADGVVARHVRIGLVPPDRGRFGLSEVEVYADDRNVARQATVTSSADPSTWSGPWPRSLLVDGFTSYGRLKDLPEWLDGWDRRNQLGNELARLQGEYDALARAARRRAWRGLGAVALLVLGAGIAGLVAVRRRRERDLRTLRTRLARDLHDEIGSNLAAIAVLSELGASARDGATGGDHDWQEVNRIAHESMDGMREVLWLVGARDEAGPDLASHLRRVAERMLPGVEVAWTISPEPLPWAWPSAARRELFLFFKEALANVVRHARATRVELTLVVADGALRLEVRDAGVGFDPASARRGMGLASLRARARTLGGRLAITARPGAGTSVALVVPLGHLETAGEDRSHDL